MTRRRDSIQVRLSDEEKDKLEAIAQAEGTNKSEVLRRQLENLPDPRENTKTQEQE